MNLKRLAIVGLFFTLALSLFVIAEPFGATVTENSDTRGSADAAQSNDALAGNITNLDITGASVTQSWQGYFGNVTGTIQLEDASGNILYNWSLASPEGEVYASTNGTGIDWSYTQCFNFTASQSFASDTGNAGGTSQFGYNLEYIESAFGIASDDVDGVNETFSLTGSHENGESLTHDLFYTNSLEFAAGECLSTHLFDSTESASDSNFQQVLLYEPTSYSIVFASILNEDVAGFDDNLHDFQMLVPEDGHGTNTATTTYYFYVELE